MHLVVVALLSPYMYWYMYWYMYKYVYMYMYHNYVVLYLSEGNNNPSSSLRCQCQPPSVQLWLVIMHFMRCLTVRVLFA